MIKNSPANAGDPGSIPGVERSPGEENGNPFQYSCLGNPVDRGAWWGTVQEMQETWVRSLGCKDPLEKKMATHSSVLAWRIPRTEKLGRL